MLFTKQTVLDIVRVFHIILLLVLVVGPYFTKNKYVLSSFLLMYIILIAQWYVFGFCIITQLEDFLSEKKQNDILSRDVGSGGRYFQKNFGFSRKDIKDIQGIVLLLNGLYIHYKLMKVM